METLGIMTKVGIPLSQLATSRRPCETRSSPAQLKITNLYTRTVQFVDPPGGVCQPCTWLLGTFIILYYHVDDVIELPQDGCQGRHRHASCQKNSFSLCVFKVRWPVTSQVRSGSFLWRTRMWTLWRPTETSPVTWLLERSGLPRTVSEHSQLAADFMTGFRFISSFLHSILLNHFWSHFVFHQITCTHLRLFCHSGMKRFAGGQSLQSRFSENWKYDPHDKIYLWTYPFLFTLFNELFIFLKNIYFMLLL